MSTLNSPSPRDWRGNPLNTGTTAIPASVLDNDPSMQIQRRNPMWNWLAEQNRLGRETARQRELAQAEFEKNITASQLATREHVSDRLYKMIVRLEDESAELHSQLERKRKV
jgi:hypothetical protein